jgi:hypothetical protein
MQFVVLTTASSVMLVGFNSAQEGIKFVLLGRNFGGYFLKLSNHTTVRFMV